MTKTYLLLNIVFTNSVIERLREEAKSGNSISYRLASVSIFIFIYLFNNILNYVFSFLTMIFVSLNYYVTKVSGFYLPKSNWFQLLMNF